MLHNKYIKCFTNLQSKKIKADPSKSSHASIPSQCFHKSDSHLACENEWPRAVESSLQCCDLKGLYHILATSGPMLKTTVTVCIEIIDLPQHGRSIFALNLFSLFVSIIKVNSFCVSHHGHMTGRGCFSFPLVSVQALTDLSSDV